MAHDGRRVLVIGAGLAGLLAAGRLEQAGVEVLLLEKSRGVGGRMATRRFGEGVFDHGAQFFTVREPLFKELVERWLAQGWATWWSNGFAAPDRAYKPDGHPRYRGQAGMTTIPKALAGTLAIRLKAQVEAITKYRDGWEIRLQDGEVIHSRGVVLTPPPPQAAALLSAGGVELPARVSSDLADLTYDPCIAVLALLDEPGAIPAPGGMQFEAGPVRWIADNQQKGISPSGSAVTIHASAAYSHAHWETPAAAIVEELLAAAAPWVGRGRSQTQIQRWRFSQPRARHPERCLTVEGDAPLVFAGDAFGGPKIEGAALSGLRAAEVMLEMLGGR